MPNTASLPARYSETLFQAPSTAKGDIDQDFIDRHTIGFDELHDVVRGYTPARVEAISGVSAGQLCAAADLIGTSTMLVSTCLQGIYQSNQATAAAVQINNINLILGRIGRPGPVAAGDPLTLSLPTKATSFRIILWRCWEQFEHVIARLNTAAGTGDDRVQC